ncbi:unnamed protein product [Rotaria sordida]|uniref:Uncharacterized protein n=1 Tax=Rotaria sordida TaxID=392033 RepID=A0A814C7N6_9BILA|nr:unnamed protein product [Rotaria sordida]
MNISLMDSKIDEYEQQLLSNPEKLVQHLSDRLDEIEQTLNDDENFCNQDIDSTINYIKIIEKKFYENIQNLKDKLENIRLKNKNLSEENKKQFLDQCNEINELFTSQNYEQAWKKFKDYEKNFQRSTLIQHIPKLHMNELDIENFFSSDHKINKPSTQSTIIVKTPVITTDDNNNKQDFDDNDIQMTKKELLRQEKNIESGYADDDNEEVNYEKKEDYDISNFGIRSKRLDNQSTTATTLTNNTIRNDNQSPITNTTGPRRIQFSTRLKSTSNSNNLLFSGRNISASSSIQNNHVNSHDNHRQIVNTTSPPSLIQRQTISIPNDKVERLILNPVSHYQHERNMFLLITCDAQYIVCFKSQLNRLDRWQLGTIERRFHKEYTLNWHDGLIISMGSIQTGIIYMFTEREFFIYSLNQRRKLDTRMLPHGDDDGLEITYPRYNESQRGIGTVYDKYMYHIYLNRNCRWTLSKNLLEKLVHQYDYDLTSMFPNVRRFIHLCVNEKTINFLVQMDDSSYGVVFCSITNDNIIHEKLPSIKLQRAQQPLTIYSAFIKSLNQYIFFINDPSIDILHILNTEQYLESYSVDCYAICYVADKHELIIVTNNSISSINLNQSNLFFTKFSNKCLSNV